MTHAGDSIMCWESKWLKALRVQLMGLSSLLAWMCTREWHTTVLSSQTWSLPQRRVHCVTAGMSSCGEIYAKRYPTVDREGQHIQN
jgi:hypothetical protein